MFMCLSAIPVEAQRFKAVSQSLANTASAVTQEALYKNRADSINKDKQVTLLHATTRYLLKQRDMQSREREIGFQNKIAYKLLVSQCKGLIEDLDVMMENASKHPEHMAGCISAGSDILMQAYATVRMVVVAAMQSKVPLPWKVDYEKFLEGKDKTPIYANDKEKSKNDTDKANLLYPSERYNILNQAFEQLVNLRIAIRRVNSKLEVEMTWQKAVEYALLFDNHIKDAHQKAYATFQADFHNRPLP